MKAFNKKRKLKHTTKPKLRYLESYQYYFLEATYTKKRYKKLKKVKKEIHYKLYPNGYDYEDYLEEYKRKDEHSITTKRCQGRYTFFWHLDAINRRSYKYKLKMGLI